MHFQFDYPSKTIPVTATDLTLLIILSREQERGSDMHFQFNDPSKTIPVTATRPNPHHYP